MHISSKIHPLFEMNFQGWSAVGGDRMLCGLLFSALAAHAAIVPVAGSVVKLENQQGHYQLFRNGKPYFIKGAGGNGSLKLLANCGGNSIRTWGADKIGQDLDQAQAAGLTVTVGIWLQHSDAFDYHNAEKVAKQKEMCEDLVRRYKNHPAVLIWAFGNEMEGYAEANDPAVWSAIDDIAASSKTIDPNHPTMTVIAEVGGQRVPNFQRYCPHVDILGINSYGGAPSLAERYRKAGGSKPFVLTEFGPPGWWESPKSLFGAPLELTSTEKAARYRQSYESAVSGQPGLCLGSYAFLWSFKQEGSATWFGMLLPDGSRTEAVDTMMELWSGKPLSNQCPKIDALTVSKSGGLLPGESISASLKASDPNGDPLTVNWVLTGDTGSKEGGESMPVPRAFPSAISESTRGSATISMPAAPGIYRLFAYVRDGHGGAAVANVPLQVVKP